MMLWKLKISELWNILDRVSRTNILCFYYIHLLLSLHTPLHIATNEKANIKTIQRLLNNKAEVNAKDKVGYIFHNFN